MTFERSQEIGPEKAFLGVTRNERGELEFVPVYLKVHFDWAKQWRSIAGDGPEVPLTAWGQPCPIPHALG